MNRRREIARGAEVMLDFVSALADGKDDDELVFIESAVKALGSACGVEVTEEFEPITAGELRARTRNGKAALARGDGP